MSDSASRLPARPSLEQLRKQAKDRLKTLRAQGTEATLADVQFALAREYGFQSWADLAHHVETMNPAGVRKFEQMTEELAAAYTSGDSESIREFNWTYGTSFVWHREPEAMHRQLPAWFASESRSMDLAVADARNLLARKMGLDTWDELVRSMSGPRATSPGVLTETSFCRIDPEGGMAVDGAAADQHWDAILAVITERGITGVHVNGLTDRGLEELSRATQITRLGTGGAQLTDEGMRHLARMPQLEELSLGGPKCRITDRGLKPLRHLRALRRFTIPWAQQISDAGIANLAVCERLERVDLMGTPTGDGALRALMGKTHLAQLASGRLVTDAGLPLLHQFPVFRTPFEGEAKYDLMSFSAQPNNLLLDGPFTDKGLSALAGLEGLVGVNLFWHTPAFTPAGLSAFADVPNLAFLGCDGKRCNDEAMRHIALIPRLRMLMAQGTIATDDGFEALSRSRSIEYIWGRECPNLTGRGFVTLAAMPSLRGLAVSCARVEADALAILPRFPRLTALMAMDVDDAGFRHVGGCARLEHLWCMYCRETTDDATEHLAELSHLKSYYAGMTKITDRSLEILSGLTTLERLEFWAIAEITDAGLKALAVLPRLREVSIEGSPRVTRAGLAQFATHVRVKYET
jgi:internalin A